jgi:hypothetical protein
MINLNLKIENPWNDRWHMIWCKNGVFNKHKAWEFNGYLTNSIVEVYFDLKLTGDHAGLKVLLSLFGYTSELNIYDRRHWDYETNTWATP